MSLFQDTTHSNHPSEAVPSQTLRQGIFFNGQAGHITYKQKPKKQKNSKMDKSATSVYRIVKRPKLTYTFELKPDVSFFSHRFRQLPSYTLADELGDYLVPRLPAETKEAASCLAQTFLLCECMDLYPSFQEAWKESVREKHFADTTMTLEGKAKKAMDIMGMAIESGVSHLRLTHSDERFAFLVTCLRMHMGMIMNQTAYLCFVYLAEQIKPGTNGEKHTKLYTDLMQYAHGLTDKLTTLLI